MGLDRRGFVKFVVGGVAGTLFTPVIWKGMDDAAKWSQNWGWIPRLPKGERKAVPALSKLCKSGCAVKVQTVGGAPFAALGNPDNPMLTEVIFCITCYCIVLVIEYVPIILEQKQLYRIPFIHHLAHNMTTGATLEECARALLADGAARVDVLALARA